MTTDYISRLKPTLIESRAREFLAKESVTKEDTWKLLNDLHADGDRAVNAFTKRLLNVCVVWLASYAVSTNAVAEGSISSFKIGQLKLVVLFAPIMIAYLYHGAANLLASITIGGRIIEACYTKIFPGVSNEEIDAIRHSSGALSFEHLLVSRAVPASGCLWFTSGLIIVSTMFGTLPLVFHSFYLEMSAPYALSLRLVVLLVAVGALSRALLVQILVLRLTKSEDAQTPA